MKARQLNSTLYPIEFLMVSAADKSTRMPGLTPTVLICKSGGSFAPPVGAIAEIGNGWYRLEAHAADRDVLGTLIFIANAPGADPVDTTYAIVAFNPFDGAGLGLSRLDQAVSAAGPDTAGTTTLLSRIIGTLSAGTHTPQSGDSFARLGAPAGASVSADLATRLATAGYTAPDNAGIATLVSRIVGTLAAGSHAPQSGDSFARIGAPVGVSLVADVATRLATAGYVAPDNAGIAAARAEIAALNDISAADLLAAVVEGGESLAMVLRVLRAFAAGAVEVSGNVRSFRSADGLTVRISGTEDADGRRSGVIVNGS